jgi:hypothetical protein
MNCNEHITPNPRSRSRLNGVTHVEATPTYDTSRRAKPSQPVGPDLPPKIIPRDATSSEGGKGRLDAPRSSCAIHASNGNWKKAGTSSHGQKLTSKIAPHVSRVSNSIEPYDMCLELERERRKGSPTVILDPNSRQTGSYDSIAKTPVNSGTSRS